MKSSVAAVAFLVVATALFACDAGSADQGSPTPVPLDQFSVRAAEVTCSQNLKCSSATDLAGRTLQECDDETRVGFSLLGTSIDQGRASGRISYDAAKMGMCIAAIGQLPCDNWLLGFTLLKNQPAVCLEAVVALVPAGSPCQQDIECKTRHCEGSDPNATPPVDGACTQAVASGASCAGGLSCADGLYCDDTSQKCADRKAAGKVCALDDECLNVCNTTTHVCSSYVGCGVADGDSPPARVAWVFAGVVMLMGTLRRRSKQRGHFAEPSPKRCQRARVRRVG